MLTDPKQLNLQLIFKRMEVTEMVLIAGGIVLAVVLFYIYSYMKDKKSLKKPAVKENTESQASLQLKLNAYERLVLLADRIALPNLISRVNQPGLSAREMQSLLTQSIRQEFEHNITQQIYVSAEAWNAIRNLKEQNTLIINQVASLLPDTANGNDLNRHLLEMLMENPKASLHNLVADALSFEAKKLMD
jgi:hypothetical protein